MPVPPEYQRATDDFYAFLVAARDQTGLGSTHQAFTMVQGVLHVFRRRLTLQQAILFAGILPPGLRALFVADWNPDEELRHFESIEVMTADVQNLRRAHNFAPPSAIADVAAALKQHVNVEELNRVLVSIGNEALAFWSTSTSTGSGAPGTGGCGFTPQPAKGNMTGFTAKTIKRSCVQRFQAPPDKVFPLLCPVREYEWIEGWRCDLLHSDSGIAEKHCVFRTYPPGETSDDVWVISRYEPPARIEFVCVNALRVKCLSIALTDNGDGTTRAENEQLLVSLTEEGNRLLDSMADSFSFEMRLGEAMLNHYLTTGNRLPMQEAVAIASKPR